MAEAAPGRRTWVKICGCTSAAEVAAAAAAGADAVGLIFAPSPRQVSLAQALSAAAAAPARLQLVGVFVDPLPADLERVAGSLPRLLPQFAGTEAPELCRQLGRPYLKVFRVGGDTAPGELREQLAAYPDGRPVLETWAEGGGGSGRSFDWSLAQGLAPGTAVISGGLRPENVAACVRRLRPFGVDVRSGVSTAGRPDPGKMAAFVSAARSQDATA